MTSRKPRVSFAPSARTDLIERASFYAMEAGEAISDRFVEAIAQTVDLLVRMPKIGRVFLPATADLKPEIRRIALSTPFHQITVFYSCTQRELRVERLLH